jgi:DNA-binding transcriptional LysR family regulator
MARGRASNLEAPMNWRTIDLNLLVVFDALAQDRSVTRAGQRLGISQPALSHALARLRHMLKDDLFLRTPAGMEPTPRAQELVEPIRQALSGLRDALAGAHNFDPAGARQSFTIAVNNHAALVMAPPLAVAATTDAPGVRLDFRPSGTLDTPDLLDRAEIDIALGTVAAPGERFADRRLFHDGFVAVLRKAHHAAAVEGPISLETLAELPHLTLSSTGENTDFVDARLEEAGFAREVALRAPLLAAGAVLAQSDMVAVMSERAARQFATYLPLSILALPFPTPTLTTAMLWHRRSDAVPAHGWLRSMIVKVARSL